VKYAEVCKADSVTIRPLEKDAFIKRKVKPDSMKKITKKQIREAAKMLELGQDEEKIIFAKKVFAQLMKMQ
jgi:hypothetical protein